MVFGSTAPSKSNKTSQLMQQFFFCRRRNALIPMFILRFSTFALKAIRKQNKWAKDELILKTELEKCL